MKHDVYVLQMNNQDKVVTLIYETAKEYVEKYYPSELEFFDTVWSAMELKNVNDLKEIYKSEISVMGKLDNLSFESASSTLISEFIVALTAHIIYGIFIEDQVKEIKAKLEAKGIENIIKNQVFDFIFNVKKLHLYNLKSKT